MYINCVKVETLGSGSIYFQNQSVTLQIFEKFTHIYANVGFVFVDT
jgi:ABC-type polar amino acid transport system ATPase subunit